MKIKPFYKILSCGIFFMSLLTLIASCSKEDMPNTKYLQAYLADNEFQTDVSLPVLSFELFADGTVNRGETPAKVTIANPVKLSRTSPADVTVNLKFGDKAIVDEYNRVNNTSYRVLPEGAVNLSKESITIPSGKLGPEEKELILTVLKPGLLSIDANDYLLPIVLKTIESNDGGVKPGTTAMYVKVRPTGFAVALKIPNSQTNLLNMSYATTGVGGVYLPPADGVFQVGLSPAAGVSTAVEVVPGDAAMVAAYNTANKTEHILLPAANYTISAAGNVTFAPGQSTANLSVAIKDGQQLDPLKKYLLPLTIKQGNIAFTDQAAKVIMVLLTGKITNVNPANSGLTGTTAIRTGWALTSSANFTTKAVARLVDGSNSTSWRSNGILPAWVVLDMGNSSAVKGFSIIPNYEYRTSDFIEMDVLSSTDGTTWKAEGQYVGPATLASSSATLPDVKTVKFIIPVTARYFKFNITKSTLGTYSGMCELNAIQ
ncbi:BT_3987 domain-containing protein [Pedobacter gandavensis]|uniref:BT_3987 domain-containing protein n=1 Tax=Pedobacter gandavensis TaxID=2679963 RepID=UPI002930500A|nr:DUF1735 domain-containing protein [Pedobacter gandavensis]